MTQRPAHMVPDGGCEHEHPGRAEMAMGGTEARQGRLETRARQPKVVALESRGLTWALLLEDFGSDVAAVEWFVPAPK